MKPQINLPERLPRTQSVVSPKKRKSLHQWRLHLWNFEQSKFAIFAFLFVTLCAAHANAQIIQFWDEEHFEYGLFTDPVASVKEEGLLLGVEIQGVFYWGYVRAAITNFDALEAGYWDLTIGGGVSLQLFNYDKIRYYGGPQIGLIKRGGLIGGYTYPTVGIEAGLDWYLGTNFVIGGRVSRNYRSDFDFWEHDVANYWVNNGFVRVAWTFGK